MKNSLKLVILIVSVTLCFSIQAKPAKNIQTWANKSGQSVQAEIFAIHLPYVFLKRKNGKELNIPLSALDAPSQAQAKLFFETPRENSPNQETKLDKLLKTKVVTLDNGELVPFDLESQPDKEFYAFYFSAHWCGPCRRFTPRLVEFYKTMKNLGRDEFELFFVSSDKGPMSMKNYMEENKMPWPAIKFKNASSSVVTKYKGNGIPCLVVTDTDGNVLFHSYQGAEYLGPSDPMNKFREVLLNRHKLEKPIAKADTQDS